MCRRRGGARKPKGLKSLFYFSALKRTVFAFENPGGGIAHFSFGSLFGSLLYHRSVELGVCAPWPFVFSRGKTNDRLRWDPYQRKPRDHLS